MAQEPQFYIASDGTSYRLNTISGVREVLSDEGSGLPSIEYITERGPFQHGESVIDYFLRPRVVQYVIRQKFCSRAAAYDGRTALINSIRPNRAGGPTGTLRKILPGGVYRDLTVVPLEGPKFEPRRLDAWDEWSIQEVVRFMAHNPVYFNPTQKTSVHLPCNDPLTPFPYTFPFYFPVPCELVFPITFPIEFYGFDVERDINYLGNWEEYPTIEVIGPASGLLKIENVTTGEHISFTGYNLLAGEILTINLAYGAKTATLVNGTNYLRYVTSDSDLATFHLQPGLNTMRVIASSSGINTRITLKWYERFLGY